MTMQGQAEIYDLGYQSYEGPREGRSRARRAVFENGVRTLLGIGRGGRAKILPVLLFLGAISPALVFVLILSIVSEGDFVPGPSDYYGIVGTLLVIFAAVMAPELLLSDRQYNVLQLYLVRPLTSTDYVAARFLAFFFVVLALVYSGQIILQAGLILTADEQLEYLRDNWLDIPRFLAAGVVYALFITAIPLAVTTVISRRAYVAALVIGAFLVSSFFTDSLIAGNCTETVTVQGDDIAREVECTPIIGDSAPYVALANLFQTPANISDLIFDVESGSPSGTEVAKLNAAFPVATYIALTLLPCLLLWQRYRRLAL